MSTRALFWKIMCPGVAFSCKEGRQESRICHEDGCKEHRENVTVQLLKHTLVEH